MINVTQSVRCVPGARLEINGIGFRVISIHTEPHGPMSIYEPGVQIDLEVPALKEYRATRHYSRPECRTGISEARFGGYLRPGFPVIIIEEPGDKNPPFGTHDIARIWLEQEDEGFKLVGNGGHLGN